MFQYMTEKRLKYYDQVIEIYKRTGYSHRRIAKMNIVPVGEHAIHDWIANFKAGNDSLSSVNAMKSNQETNNEELEALKKKVAELEEQFKYQEMRADAYDTMIDIAEKKFNIDLN